MTQQDCLSHEDRKLFHKHDKISVSSVTEVGDDTLALTHPYCFIAAF